VVYADLDQIKNSGASIIICLSMRRKILIAISLLFVIAFSITAIIPVQAAQEQRSSVSGSSRLAYQAGSATVMRESPTRAGSTTPPGSQTPTDSKKVVPVITVTPQPNGSYIHEVKSGQALWSIAIAYGVKVNDIIALNLLSTTNPVIYAGQKLLVKPGPTRTNTLPASDTPPPPTKTPRPTSTRRPPQPTRTITLSLTPTEKPILPNVPSLQTLNRRSIGIGIVIVCGLGLLILATNSMRTKK
jgi:LysM repeat protein